MSVYTIIEKDEAGKDVASYALSANGRIDIITPTSNGNLWGNLWSRCLGVFLPAGYPHTVTSDYMWYQIYDSLQAFSSSIAGLLSSRAVLEGVGVGDASASPTAALLLSIIQESMGRVATILFAYRLGTSLEPECKMYRLAADIFNDMAMIIDCLSPALPKAPKVVLLSFSSILRALCGVAAGSSKASLSAHFARCGNLGELNAKDTSQETVISLMGMLAGSIVVSYVTTPFATWTWLIALLSIHLATNHAAVRAVSMRSLNRQRANIVMSEYFDSQCILSPEEVSFRERIFEWDGVLRWKASAPFATARIGVSLQDMVMTLAQAHHLTGAVRDSNLILQVLIEIFKGEDFLLWYNVRQRAAYIVLKTGASANDQLKAWTLGLYCAHHLKDQDATSAPADKIMDQIGGLLKEVSNQWDDLMARLKTAGWDTEIANLETTSGTRVHL